MCPADDSGIDRAIDRVAEQMTAGEPGGALRARVIARLDAGAARTPRAWLLMPLAAAALVLVALFVARERRSGSPPPTVARAPQNAPQDTGRPRASEPSRAETISAQAPQPETSETSAPARPAAQRAAPATRRPPALAPSAVEALAPPRLAVPSIALNEIDPAASIRLPRLETIEPITVAPLGEPQGERP